MQKYLKMRNNEKYSEKIRKFSKNEKKIQ